MSAIVRRLLIAVVVVVAVSASLALRADAHPELERAVPAPDAVLAGPPGRIELWMTEAVASGAGSPAIAVLDEQGVALSSSEVRLDPDDPRHLVAEVSGIGYGTFTVAWTARSAVDGHTLTGTYAFRVGGSSRAPAAATVEGEVPPAWAVATRWLTFLGAGLAAAAMLFGVAIVRGEAPDGAAARRLGIAAAAAGIAMLATVAEPLLQTLSPPAGLTAPSLSDAVRGLPDAWYLRAPGLLVAAGAAALARLPRRDRSPLAVVGAIAALVALLGLALTSHASARDSLRLPALGSAVIHQWSVALWAGGLVALAVSRPTLSGEHATPWLRRFSWTALGLALGGLATGVVNAGFVLPGPAALFESDYGRVLLVKAALVLAALAFGAIHRLAIHRAIATAVAATRRTIPVEAVVLAAVILGGSLLALLAPPSVARGIFERVDLAAPLTGEGPGALHARFVIDPSAQGSNDLSVAITAGQPVSFGPGGTLLSAAVARDIALIRVTLTNLERQTAPAIIELTPDPDGWFRAQDVALGLDGWWRADILVRQLGAEDRTLPFYFILPDPNVHGDDAVDVPVDTAAARAVFARGIDNLQSLHSVHFVERLSGGTGTVAVSDHTTHDGSDPSQPAALRIVTDDFELIRTGGLQWIREDGGDWNRTDATAVLPPSSWADDYLTAIGFRAGARELVGDRPATIVTFFVPSERFADAWYAWWVDDETGHILRETMISRGHYMIRDFSAFDSAPPIAAPE